MLIYNDADTNQKITEYIRVDTDTFYKVSIMYKECAMGFFDSVLGLVVSASNKFNSFESVKDRAPNEIGVYLMKHKGKVMYVGRAIEDRPGQSPKGLRKRLQEHWRGADAGKPELNRYRDEITVEIRICQSVEDAKALEGRLIRQYDTVGNGWNLRYEG